MSLACLRVLLCSKDTGVALRSLRGYTDGGNTGKRRKRYVHIYTSSWEEGCRGAEGRGGR